MALLITTAYALAAVVLAGICYQASLIVYNIFVHPLRKYPGPFWYRASRLPYMKHWIGGDFGQNLNKLHEKYGDVVRIAPNELSFTNPQAWKSIYGHRQHGQEEMDKDSRFYRSLDDYAPDIITANREEHARLRRLLSHGFSDRSMREQEPMIMQYIDLLVRRLYENSESGTKPLDIVKWYNWTTFDIIGDLAFGESFNCLDNSSYHPWVATLFSSVKAGAFDRISSHYPAIRSLIRMFIPKSLIAKHLVFKQITKEKVEHRMTIEEERPDFFGSILKKKEELGINPLQLESNATVLIVAGSETTATVLSGATYFLLTHPEARQKLEQEVRGAFASDEEITIESVSKLTYMLACLNETLRMYPPVPIGLPRVVPKGGDTIADQYVPEDTIVSISHWAIHSQPSNFTKPMEFHPERFTEEKLFPNDHRDAMQPFSFGPRNCLGKNLAYAEMRLILAKIIYHFDLKLASESEDWVAKQDMYILWEKVPLMVHVTPRKT